MTINKYKNIKFQDNVSYFCSLDDINFFLVCLDMILFPCTRGYINTTLSNSQIFNIICFMICIPITFLIDILILIYVLLLSIIVIIIFGSIIIISVTIFVAINILTCCIPTICIYLYYEHTNSQTLFT